MTTHSKATTFYPFRKRGHVRTLGLQAVIQAIGFAQSTTVSAALKGAGVSNILWQGRGEHPLLGPISIGRRR